MADTVDVKTTLKSEIEAAILKMLDEVVTPERIQTATDYIHNLVQEHIKGQVPNVNVNVNVEKQAE